MDIVIYDDNISFIDELTTIINGFNAKHNNIFNIIMRTNKTEKILEYIENSGLISVFLLDIVADNMLMGFRLSKLIKSVNQENIVIYITNYPSRIMFNMKEKLTALCFILKKNNQFFLELEQSLLYAYKLLNEKIFYVAQNNDTVNKIFFSDIYYFEKIKSTHNICVVYKDGYAIFKRSLKSLRTELNNYFCYSHKSFIVNTQNIKTIDKKNNTIHFDNGQKCAFSVFYKKELLKWINS